MYFYFINAIFWIWIYMSDPNPYVGHCHESKRSRVRHTQYGESCSQYVASDIDLT